MEGPLATKLTELEARLAGFGSVVVAYSGGVDSSLVAEVAHRVLGEEALAVTAVSASLARRELEDARELARRRGWNHRVVRTHEVAREEYARNDPQRCYWCKTELFDVLEPIAGSEATICVGTNLDDLGDHRPGTAAAAERRIAAPLAESELSKAEVRAISREMGLPTADKQASPCLASRFAYGVRVTPQGLRRIDRAEELVRELGFDVLRVRDHGELARIELAPADIARAAEMADRIAAELKSLGFNYVTLDLEGFRSGSLNEVLPAPRLRAQEPTPNALQPDPLA